MKRYIWQKKVMIFIIILYVILYMVSFLPIDKTKIYEHFYEHDKYTPNLVSTMMLVGASVTLFIGGICFWRKGSIGKTLYTSVFHICLVCLSIMSAKKLLVNTMETGATTAIFCNTALVIMLHIILVCSFVAIFMNVWMIFGSKEKISCDVKKDCVDEKPTYLHWIIIVTMFVSVELSLVYMYGGLVFVALISIPHLLAFAIPASLVLILIAKEWTNKGKYIQTIISYIVYMFIIYGCFYNMFYRSVYWVSIRYSINELFFDGFIGAVNVMVAGVVAITLLIKYAIGNMHRFR